MSKQKITYPDYGSRIMRVLEALTPLTGAVAPVEHADFIGQIYVETTTPALYVAVATDSEEAANDWSLSTIAAVPAAVAAAILEADIPGNIESITIAAVPAAVDAAVPAAVDAAVPAAVDAAILEADIPGKIELKAAEFEPLTGATAPAVNAEFIGQLYVDTVAEKVYISVAVGSATPKDDWVNYDGAIASLLSSIEALEPVSSTVAPAVNAEFIGQLYVDTATPAAYIAVAVGSVTPADDWKELTVGL